MNTQNKLVVIIMLFSFSLLSVIGQSAYDNRHKFYDRKNGFVPDKVTAEKIAEIVLLNIYGEGIKRQKPFIVKLKDNKIWIIQGCWNSKDINLKAGVAYMEIQKSDGKILKVTHGK
jgi:NTF2 fold immunity protein